MHKQFSNQNSRLQVGYAYVMYNQKIMSKMYYEHIKFNSVQRSINVFDAKGNVVLRGDLALGLRHSKPYKCRDKLTGKNIECWEWTNMAKLFLSLDEKFNGVSSDNAPTIKCYNFRWETLAEDFSPIDCFNLGAESGMWYGGGITKDADWLLNEGSLPFSPFITGDAR